MDPATLLPLLLLAVLFWALILRPAQKRQREQASVMAALLPGARVMTTAGLFATVREVRDDQVDLEVAPGVVVTYVRQAVAKVIPQEPEPTTRDAGEDAAPDDAPGSDTGA